MTLKRLSIKVTEDMYNNLKQDADSRALTMNAIVIFALEEYFKQQKDKSNDRFI